jgi:hypothetical protein
MKIRVTSTTNLIAFLRKLKVVDKSVLLELTAEKFFCKVATPDKSVMKYSSVDNSSVFETIENWPFKNSDRIKLGIMDVTRFMDCFRHFRPEEDIFLELNVQDIDGEPTATEIKVLSDSLSIRIKCADLSLLSYIGDDILKIVHTKEDPIATFKIYSSDFNAIDSLCGLETNNQELLKFEISDSEVISSGDSFRYKLNIGKSDINTTSGLTSLIYKSKMNYLDAESYTIYVHSNRMIFFSDHSETSTALGLIEQ